MADIFNKEKRSWLMSRIRGKDTKPELIVRRFLHFNGFRYRLHSNKLPGKPDIVLTKYKTVVFVHGCFWHGHKGCSKASVPKTRAEWWQNKMITNSRNDVKNQKLLRKAGWNVIVIWQCNLHFTRIETTSKKLLKSLKKRNIQQM